MGEGVTEGMKWRWDLRVIGNEEKASVRMYPACCDECVQEIGDCVRGLEVKCVLVRDKRCWGVKEESDGGWRVVLLVRLGCGLGATAGYFDVLDVGEAGVIQKLNRSSVDCYECW